MQPPAIYHFTKRYLYIYLHSEKYFYLIFHAAIITSHRSNSLNIHDQPSPIVSKIALHLAGIVWIRPQEGQYTVFG